MSFSKVVLLLQTGHPICTLRSKSGEPAQGPDQGMAALVRRRIDHVIRKLHRWHGERRFHAAFARAIVALLLFVIDPLGVAMQKSLAIEKNFAWLVGNVWAYEPSDRLAVVLIEEEDLRSPAFQVDWPIPYAKTASLIRLLACAGASGVFFDYTASNQFNLAVGQDDLEAMVLNSSDAPRCNDDNTPPRIPVYFGATEEVIHLSLISERPRSRVLDRR